MLFVPAYDLDSALNLSPAEIEMLLMRYSKHKIDEVEMQVRLHGGEVKPRIEEKKVDVDTEKAYHNLAMQRMRQL